ncbi:MAG TPA: hypothetical protein VM782_01655 [Stellaceae bacterium]|nr:hypothetical protein [Stellaceae bacterium]
MSQLPRVTHAFLDDAKVSDYLLNPNHSPQAAGKEKFFTAHGFSRAAVDQLKRALLDHARRNQISGALTTAFGEKYEVSCQLTTPDGRNPCVISVWIVEPPDLNPRFVTAYPNPP